MNLIDKMIKRTKPTALHLHYTRERPALYNITFSNVNIDEARFKNILLSYFCYDQTQVDELFKKLQMRHYLSIGKYTKDIAETKLREINDGISFEEDLNVIMTINNQ